MDGANIMTFCNYNDIEDYCKFTNQYMYYYTEVIESNGKLVVNTSISSPVRRLNLYTQQSDIITYQDNSSDIVPCNQTDSGDILSDWECYVIWKQTNTTLDPEDDVWTEAKSKLIENEYNQKIKEGYQVTVNGNNVSLPRDKDSQLKILSTLVNSTISQIDPVVQDINGNDISIPRQILQNSIDDYIKDNTDLESAKSQALIDLSENNGNRNVSEVSLNFVKLDTQCGPGYRLQGGNCVQIV